MGALQDTSQSTEVSKLLSCRIRSSYRITVTFRGRGGVATENVNLPPAPERIFIERISVAFLPLNTSLTAPTTSTSRH